MTKKVYQAVNKGEFSPIDMLSMGNKVRKVVSGQLINQRRHLLGRISQARRSAGNKDLL
jgi:hypothetical protein